MNQSSWLTPGIITSCKRKKELYKELKNSSNATLASYYTDYAKILSRVIREAKITENDQLILNSHNKVKTTWDIVNKESGKSKKRGEIQAVNVEGKKMTRQQKIVETFNEYFIAIAENVKRQNKNNFINDEYFIAIAENVKRQNKNNFINDDNDTMDSHTLLWNKLLLTPTQVWNGNAQQQKKLNEL